MGNLITYRSSSGATGKVILSDGTVYEFDKPVTAAELMLEYPQQVVVELNSVVKEKRPDPLPADKNLDTKKIYVMLPVKRGKPVAVSSEESRRVLLSANSVLRSQSHLTASRFLLMFAKICPAVTEAELKKVKNVEARAAEAEVKFAADDLVESLEGRPEYLNRQISGKGWKPSLDTIKEKKFEKKVPHWLLHKSYISLIN